MLLAHFPKKIISDMREEIGMQKGDKPEKNRKNPAVAAAGFGHAAAADAGAGCARLGRWRD